MPLRRSRTRKLKGQGMVEFMLVLPVLLLLIFAIIEIARVLHAWMAIENGARFGVRYAVTGEYDGSHCAGYPGGVCDDRSEEDGARIPSIKDVVSAGAVAILRDDSVGTVGQQGFFKVTVCSNKTGVWYTPSDPDTPTAADCLPAEDPGGPGDRVSVTVDFDHPLITPIISSWWPVMHLSAKREGIVENFRTARVVGLPATISGPTWTPSITPTPSDTPTPTSTSSPTPTVCKVPPEVEIVNPPDGAVYNDGDYIPSQALAWDPDNTDPVSCSASGPDGTGIQQVRFQFHWWDGSGWQSQYNHTESIVAYCGFGGNSPCDTLRVTTSGWPNGAPFEQGLHRMRVRAQDDEGVWGSWEEVQFTINPPPTPTPSPTPTPDCDDIYVRRRRVNGDDFEVQVQNNNVADAWLIDTWLQWPEMTGSMYYNKAYFNGTKHYDGNDYSSPTSASANVHMNGGGNRDWWEADFNNVPSGGLAGYFQARLTFNFPGWGTCVLTTSMTAVVEPTNTPAPTNTPGPTNTPRPPTRTPTYGPSPTRTPTRTPRPTSTPTRTPSGPTATRTPTKTHTPVPTSTGYTCTEC